MAMCVCVGKGGEGLCVCVCVFLLRFFWSGTRESELPRLDRRDWLWREMTISERSLLLVEDIIRTGSRIGPVTVAGLLVVTGAKCQLTTLTAGGHYGNVCNRSPPCMRKNINKPPFVRRQTPHSALRVLDCANRKGLFRFELYELQVELCEPQGTVSV